MLHLNCKFIVLKGKRASRRSRFRNMKRPLHHTHWWSGHFQYHYTQWLSAFERATAFSNASQLCGGKTTKLKISVYWIITSKWNKSIQLLLNITNTQWLSAFERAIAFSNASQLCGGEITKSKISISLSKSFYVYERNLKRLTWKFDLRTVSRVQ